MSMGFIKSLEKDIDALNAKLQIKKRENAALAEQVEDLKDQVMLLKKANSEGLLGGAGVTNKSNWFSA
jgi:cell division protein FtsB